MVIVFKRLCCSVVIVQKFRICLFILVEIQLQTMENSREFNEQPIPSFFFKTLAREIVLLKLATTKILTRNCHVWLGPKWKSK